MLNVQARWRRNFSPPHDAFAAKPADPLRLILDDATLSTDDPAVRLLQALSARANLRLYRTELGAPCHVIVGERDVARDVIPIEYVHPEEHHRTGVFNGSWEEHARVEVSERTGEYEEILRLLVLAQAAATHGLDGLVTEHDLLHVGRWRGFGKRAGASRPCDAVALVGLHLRANNDYTIQQEGPHSTFLPDEYFYRCAVMSVLPAYEPLAVVANGRWRTNADHAAAELLDAVVTRLARALRFRDYLTVRLRHDRPDEARAESLVFFESLILSLDGACDALARFLHVLFAMTGKRRGASLGKSGWIEQLRRASPGAAEVLQTPEAQLLVRAVSELRNTIHGEVLSDELYDWHDGPTIVSYLPTGVALRADLAVHVRQLVENVGSPENWGVRESDGGVIVALDRFPIELLRSVHALLSRVMDAVELSAFASDATIGAVLMPEPTALVHARLLAGLGGPSSPYRNN